MYPSNDERELVSSSYSGLQCPVFCTALCDQRVLGIGWEFETLMETWEGCVQGAHEQGGHAQGIHAHWRWMKWSLLETTLISSTSNHQQSLLSFSPLTRFSPLILILDSPCHHWCLTVSHKYKTQLRVVISPHFGQPKLLVDEPYHVSCNNFFWAWTVPPSKLRYSMIARPTPLHE